MKILISGGTGFIGTELRDFLLRNGHFLTIITRSPEKHESEAAKNQSFIDWDSDLVTAMDEANVVINLVGENIFGKFWTENVKKKLYSSRVDNTKKLVNAVRQAKIRPELMISVSGVNFYGDRGDDILNETEPPGDDFLAKLCIDWEKAAQSVEESGVRFIIFRNAVVMEKGGGALQYMLPVFKLGLGGTIGDADQYFPWVHMLDVCRAMDFVSENKDCRGIYNLAAPNPVTMNELAGTLGRVLNRPSFFKVPEFLLKTLLGEASIPLTTSLRIQPKRLQQAGFEFRYEHLDEALSDVV